MNKLLKLFFLSALLSLRVFAYTYNAGTNTYTVTGAQADASTVAGLVTTGATVIFPAGNFVWNTTGNGMVFNGVDQIKIVGAGIDVTTITLANGGGSASNPYAGFNFSNYRIGGKSFRISGMTILHDPVLYPQYGITTDAPVNFRISYIKMHQIVRRGINIGGAQSNYAFPRGVIDHCELWAPYNLSAQLITVQGNSFEFPPTVASSTDSWKLSPDINGPANVFVEDCVLRLTYPNDASIETYSGGRLYVRNSQLYNFHTGAHGNDSSTRGGLSIILENNYIENDWGSGTPYTINLRSGIGIMTGNTIVWSGTGFASTYTMQLQAYRAAGFVLTNGNPSLLSPTTPAGSFVTGRSYTISTPGTTNFMLIGAASNSAGTVFTASGPGSGTGTAINRLYSGIYTYNETNNRYEKGGDTTKYITYTSGQWRVYGDGLHQLTHDETQADTVHGYYSASGSGDMVLTTPVRARVYNNDVSNGAEYTDGNVAVFSGTHTGSDGETSLTDSAQSWATDVLLNGGTADFDDELFTLYVWNMSSGAGGFVTGNTGTNVSVALRGGTRQTWNTGDVYRITGGYPALDQVGWTGPTVFYDKDNAVTSTLNNTRYSTQVLTGCYAWDNTFNGAPDTRGMSVSFVSGVSNNASGKVTPDANYFIQSGREYFPDQTPMPGFTGYTYPHPLVDDDVDATAPTITAVSINGAGTEVTVTYSEVTSFGAGGSGGSAITPSGGAATLTYLSGTGSDTWTFSLSRTIYLPETATFAYTQPSNGVEDAAGNDLVTVSGVAVTNNSTQLAAVTAVPTRNRSAGPLGF